MNSFSNKSEPFSSKASPDNLMFFPLFLGEDYCDQKPDLHSSYKGHQDITKSNFPDQINTVLLSNNIRTIKDILFFNYTNFLFFPRIDLSIVKKVQTTVCNIIFDERDDHLDQFEERIEEPQAEIQQSIHEFTFKDINVRVTKEIFVDAIKETPFYVGLAGTKLFSSELKAIKPTQLDFSVRFENILRANFSGTLEDLLNTPFEKFLLLRNCGKVSVLHARNTILQFLKTKIIFNEGFQHKKERVYLNSEKFPTVTSIFLNKTITIPEKYYTAIINAPVSTINFSTRFIHFLQQSKIETLIDLLNYDVNKLIHYRNIGRVTIEESKKIVVRYIESKINSIEHDENENESFHLSPIDNRITKSVREILGEREYEMFLLRFTSNLTLEEIGDQFNLTRERARQIIDKSLEKIKNLSIWDQFTRFLNENYFVFTVDTLFENLVSRNLWNFNNKRLFEKIWENDFLYSQFIPYENFYLTKNENIDEMCESLRRKILTIVESVELGIGIDELRARLNLDSKMVNVSVIQFLSFKHEDFFFEEGRIFDKMFFNILFAKSLKDVIYWSMKYLEEPIHFTQLTEFIRSHNKNYSQIQNLSVHSALIRFDFCHDINRGIYALKEKNIPKHISAGEALCNLLKEKGAMLEDDIYKTLKARYTLWNIEMALQNNRHKLNRIGNNLYDLKEDIR